MCEGGSHVEKKIIIGASVSRQNTVVGARTGARALLRTGTADEYARTAERAATREAVRAESIFTKLFIRRASFFS